MPSLDIVTLAILSMVTDLVLVLVLVHARISRKTYPGFDVWIAGTVCWSLGAALTLVFRPLLPAFVAIIIGNGLIMLHPLLLYEGIIRFYGRPRRWFGTPLNLLIVLIGIAVHTYFLYGTESISMRSGNVNTVIGLIFLRIAMEPLLLYEARRQFMQWLLSLSLVPLVSLLLYRAFKLFTVVQAPALYQDPLLGWSLFYSIIGEIVLAYTYLALTGDRVERELRDSEERFRSLAEHSADIIWQLDSSLRYCYVNEADSKLRGFSREEVLGRLVTDFLTPEGTEQMLFANRERLQLEQQGVRTGSRCYEIQQLHKDGRYIWTETHAVPLRDGRGIISGYIGSTRDVSVRKSNERKQAELLMREQQAREEQEWFSTMISHEYRTPLAIIMSNIEILRMKQSMMPGQLEANLTKMQRAVNRLLEVFEQGRRKKSQMQEIALEPVAVAPFMIDLRDEALNHWGASRLLFTSHAADDTVMLADPQLLRTALLNLLDNGVKYSSAGAVVEFEARGDHQELEFLVKNRSRRMLQVESEVIFRKYTRGPNSADLAGTGVGLWLTRQIVALHGGTVDFVVDDFHDVTVTVRLPMDRGNEVEHAV